MTGSYGFFLRYVVTFLENAFVTTCTNRSVEAFEDVADGLFLGGKKVILADLLYKVTLAQELAYPALVVGEIQSATTLTQSFGFLDQHFGACHIDKVDPRGDDQNMIDSFLITDPVEYPLDTGE